MGHRSLSLYKALKEKQLFTDPYQRAPEVRGGGHGKGLKVNTLGTVSALPSLSFFASLSEVGNCSNFTLDWTDI